MIPLNLRRKTGANAPTSTADTASAAEEEELRALEARRAWIESKAEAGVRRELWLGLAFLMAQTAGFARLTFWELSWDVMEPICFYVSTVYFMVGYAFFLRTSRDPSFEGIYESRLTARRKKLMKSQGFDLGRYVELRRALGRDVGAGYSSVPPQPRPCLEFNHMSPCQSSASLSSYCGCHRREGLLA